MLRDAQLAGHDIGGIIEQITAGPMDGARSIASVLHGCLRRLQLPAQGHSVTSAQRTPENAPALAHELAAGLDDRCRELGERALANPEPWLTRHLGTPPDPGASPVLREDYAWRAGTAAAYREARGITDPQQAVSFDLHPEPELEALRKDTVRALEIADEQAGIRAMSRGELEVQVLEGDRAQATAPQDTSSQLRMTAQAEADAWQQAADAEAEHDAAQADNARSLATAMTAETSRLEAANARYEEWSARTASTRERAGKAKAELQRRDQQPLARAAPGPQSMATWWREFQADAGAVDRAIEREHQAAVYDGQPWPPERKPEAAHEGPPAVAGGREPELEQSRPGTATIQTDPEPDASEPEISAPEATEPGLADDGRAARLGDLQARADQAARRIDVQRAELDASSEHSARIEREAQPEPAAGRQPAGRRKRPMTLKWSCERSGRAGVADPRGLVCSALPGPTDAG